MGEKTGILIQARLSSSRLPGKMLMEICQIPLIEYVYLRCKTASSADLVAVITSDDPSDDKLHRFCMDNAIPVFKGSLENVLDRYVRAADFFGLTHILRICGDSPFVDIRAMDEMAGLAREQGLDYVFTGQVLDGFLSEVISKKALKHARQNTTSLNDLEHVTPYIRQNPLEFKTALLKGNGPGVDKNLSITIDTEKDYGFCCEIAKALARIKGRPWFQFSNKDVLNAIAKIKDTKGVRPEAPV